MAEPIYSADDSDSPTASTQQQQQQHYEHPYTDNHATTNSNSDSKSNNNNNNNKVKAFSHLSWIFHPILKKLLSKVLKGIIMGFAIDVVPPLIATFIGFISALVKKKSTLKSRNKIIKLCLNKQSWEAAFFLGTLAGSMEVFYHMYEAILSRIQFVNNPKTLFNIEENSTSPTWMTPPNMSIINSKKDTFSTPKKASMDTLSTARQPFTPMSFLQNANSIKKNDNTPQPKGLLITLTPSWSSESLEQDMLQAAQKNDITAVLLGKYHSKKDLLNFLSAATAAVVASPFVSVSRRIDWALFILARALDSLVLQWRKKNRKTFNTLTMSAQERQAYNSRFDADQKENAFHDHHNILKKQKSRLGQLLHRSHYLLQYVIRYYFNTLMFTSSCYVIMMAWYFSPTSLPPLYERFISRMSEISPHMLNYLRAVSRGQVQYGVHSTIFDEYCKEIGKDPSFADPYYGYKACSDLIHRGISCPENVWTRFRNGWTSSFKIYFPVHMIPHLLTHPSTILGSMGHIFYSAARSTTFLASFIAINHVFVCGVRSYLQRDSIWGSFFASLFCGLSVLFESEHRRTEMALYCMPRAFYVLWDILVWKKGRRGMRFGEVWILALGLGVLITRWRKDVQEKQERLAYQKCKQQKHNSVLPQPKTASTLKFGKHKPRVDLTVRPSVARVLNWLFA